MTSNTVDNLFVSQLPVRIVLGFVPNTFVAANGNHRRNPFLVGAQAVTFVNLVVDGVSLPFKPLSPNYMSMFSGLGMVDGSGGIMINSKEYKNGDCFYVFDLNPDLNTGGHFNLLKQGTSGSTLRLHGRGDIVVYAEFEHMIEIDKNRSVLFDFTS